MFTRLATRWRLTRCGARQRAQHGWPGLRRTLGGPAPPGRLAGPGLGGTQLRWSTRGPGRPPPPLLLPQLFKSNPPPRQMNHPDLRPLAYNQIKKEIVGSRDAIVRCGIPKAEVGGCCTWRRHQALHPLLSRPGGGGGRQRRRRPPESQGVAAPCAFLACVRAAMPPGRRLPYQSPRAVGTTSCCRYNWLRAAPPPCQVTGFRTPFLSDSPEVRRVLYDNGFRYAYSSHLDVVCTSHSRWRCTPACPAGAAAVVAVLPPPPPPTTYKPVLPKSTFFKTCHNTLYRPSCHHHHHHHHHPATSSRYDSTIGVNGGRNKLWPATLEAGVPYDCDAGGTGVGGPLRLRGLHHGNADGWGPGPRPATRRCAASELRFSSATLPTPTPYLRLQLRRPFALPSARPSAWPPHPPAQWSPCCDAGGNFCRTWEKHPGMFAVPLYSNGGNSMDYCSGEWGAGTGAATSQRCGCAWEDIVGGCPLTRFSIRRPSAARFLPADEATGAPRPGCSVYGVLKQVGASQRRGGEGGGGARLRDTIVCLACLACSTRPLALCPPVASYHCAQPSPSLPAPCHAPQQAPPPPPPRASGH